MERYLITGGAGFIESTLADYLLTVDPSCEIVIVDDLTMGKIENIRKANKSFFMKKV